MKKLKTMLGKIDEIINDFKNGSSFKHFHVKYELNPTELMYLLKETEYEMCKEDLREKLTPIQRKNILKEYNENKRIDWLQEKYFSSKYTIKKIIISQGGKIKDYDDSHRKYNINKYYFDSIDCENKAYFLGILFADGSNTKNNVVSLSLKYDDEKHVTDLAKLVAENYATVTKLEIREGEITSSGHPRCNMFSLGFNSVYMCNSLAKLGCVKKKSLILKFPENKFDNKLYRHFVRGYFMGDGSLWNPKDSDGSGMSLVSTKEFLESISLIYSKIGITCSIYKCNDDDKNTYCMRISGNRNQELALNWMMINSNIHLERKNKRYIEFMNKINSNNEKSLSSTRGYSKSSITNQYQEYEKIYKYFGQDLTLDKINSIDPNILKIDLFNQIIAGGFKFIQNKEIIQKEFINDDQLFDKISTNINKDFKICNLF